MRSRHFPFFAPSSRWLFALLGACAFLVWCDVRRAERVETVSRTDADPVFDSNSPTGYAGGKRWLIVPEHDNRSYQWIAETQQLLAGHHGRLRHIDYENAPGGRDVHSASLYRWWLATLAWVDYKITGVPLAAAAERAALWADPLLHLLLLVGTTLFVARHFGSATAAVSAIALTTLFPFAAGFLPGVPDDRGLAAICALWSVLPLVAGCEESGRRSRFPFVLSGIAGGVGLWLDVGAEVPVLAGIALSAIAVTLISPRESGATANERCETSSWRLWALSGATTSLLAYLVEYFPGHLDFRLEVNHPLFGLAWLGAGELLAQLARWRSDPKRGWSVRLNLGCAISILAIAALPVAMKWSGARALLRGDLYASRLDFLPNGIVAENLAGWLRRDGVSPALAATLLPLSLLAFALWLALRKTTPRDVRRAIALALGPSAITLALACRQLAWWSACDAALIALLAVSVPAFTAVVVSRRARWTGAGLTALIVAPGVFQLLPPPATGNIAFTRFEILGLIERGLAHWLTDRAGPGGATVLAPPDQTTPLSFHGGLRGVGTTNWENHDGLDATVRIVTATTPEIARTLIDERGISYLVLPTWDRDLDAFARWSLKNPEDSFVAALHHWALPTWLQPVPYPLPVVAGFEDQSVVVLEVTRETNPAAALSRLAEYFIETRQPDLAASTAELLQRYPAHPGALIALAETDEARGNRAGFEQTLGALVAGLDNGFDRALPWDRRVSLAIVLSLGQRNDLARDQLRLCLGKIDAAKIRSLSTGSLYRLQVLAKAFGLEIADPELRELAHRLLPAELRARLQT